jgi:hypothetical protein
MLSQELIEDIKLGVEMSLWSTARLLNLRNTVK